ncbi:MAG: MiaB/RimO family radical SAM methylthiotransferase [bacterium]|nr:MiaB/RimO family radical SAM methylthiotransferase [bacterium]
MRYHIITFGCQANESDSERIATILEKTGYSPASTENEADFIVVNMCSVRQSAVDRVYGLIEKFKKLKAKNPKLQTILTGCVLPKDKQKFREGFDQILKFPDLLKYKAKTHNNPQIFVPISNGCNNLCTYCAVPLTRGSLKCRSHKEIIKEIKNAAQNKNKEIWLLGQSVNNYYSPTNPSINFAKLMKMVCQVPGDFKIFFMSPHPQNFSDELINVLANCPKFGKYLNLPVQSGDNIILKKMGRNYTATAYKNLVKKIREKIPDINLSTDVIVGFPGETKKQFENTAKLFKEIKFNYAYISKYSPRPGTVAFKLKNNVPLAEKKRRCKILNDLL